MRVCLEAGWRCARVDLMAETTRLVHGDVLQPRMRSQSRKPIERRVVILPERTLDAIPPLTALGEFVRSRVWDDFVDIVRARVARFVDGVYDFSLSEENFRLDFAVALARRVDYPHHVFAEFPCDLAPSQKVDLFVDDEPGLCFEFKFFRPIPSGYNPPMTQHLGSLWADIIKLAALFNRERSKFLVVFMDDLFRRYFLSRGVLPSKEGEVLKATLRKERDEKTILSTVAKRLPHVQVPDEISVSLVALRDAAVPPFVGLLLRIT